MPGNEIAGHFRSTLRLFLSVDIVGSTAFKQASGDQSSDLDGDTVMPSEAWFSPLAQFYRHIEIGFSAEWKAYSDEYAGQFGWEVGSPPQFWKGAGDEVIYFKDITHHQEAYSCVQCWIKAVGEYRRLLQIKYPKLDLKATAWLAGFPVNNSEIIFRSLVGKTEEPIGGIDAAFENAKLLDQFYRNEDNSLVRDFIGPSIDTGFRLAGYSTPRKMTISIDLALMLASAEGSKPHKFAYKSMRFFYDGNHLIKGVLGGAPYPIVWVDALQDNKLIEAEDKLLRRESVDQANLKEFCEEFISKHSSWLCRPYISSGRDSLFAEMPDRHRDRVEQLKVFLENEKQRAEDIGKSNDAENQHGSEITDEEQSRLMTTIAKHTDGIKGILEALEDKHEDKGQ